MLGEQELALSARALQGYDAAQAKAVRKDNAETNDDPVDQAGNNHASCLSETSQPLQSSGHSSGAQS